MGEISADVPFKVIFDGCDVAFWNIPLNKHYWVIEKDKAIPRSFFDLQDDINLLIEEKNDLQFKYSRTIIKNQSLKIENEQLKRENELLARFICRNYDVTMINRILKEGK